ncbi:MAG: hypothetical protein IKR72_00220 [Bacteroidales bacterium]|nr:hypothetical protein [Bacteroidales bacterium]
MYKLFLQRIAAQDAVPVHNPFDLYSRMALERDFAYKSQVNNKAKQAYLFTICTAGMRTAGFLCTDRSSGGRFGDKDRWEVCRKCGTLPETIAEG